jgi:O-antigen/teichoic acid export membrane protein
MSLGKHSAANLAGTVLPLGVALCTVPVFLRYVGPERFGVLAVIWALLAYFVFFDFGLARAVVQRLSRHSNADDHIRSEILWTAVCTTFALALVGGGLLWLLADTYLTRFATISAQGREEAGKAVPWLAVALPFVLVGSVLKGALSARLRFVEINVIEVISSVLTQLAPLLAAIAGYTELQVLVPAALVSRVVSALLLLRLSRIHVPLLGSPRMFRAHLRPLAKYGGWMSVVSLLVLALVTTDRLMIGALAGAAAVAFYTIPYDLVTKANLIAGSISTAIFPRLAADLAGARSLAERTTEVLVGIMTPIVVGGVISIDLFLRLWVGSEFADASRGIAEILLFGVWLNAAVAAHQSRLLGADNPRNVVLLYLFETPVYLLVLWFALRHWGLVGAAGAYAFRVVMDSTLILLIARSFGKTVRMMFPAFIIMSLALNLAFATTATSPLRWLLGGLLLLLSLYKDRHHLRLVIEKIRR